MSEESSDLWIEFEEGLGSKGKLRMMRVMIEKPSLTFTKYSLEKETKLKPVDVRTNLKILVELGWVKEYPYQPKTYKINMEKEIVKYFANFIEMVKRIQKL
ncbi:MAG: hypothetical protein PVF96_07850 [Candidatus Bathyarchaeota archaeon]|jgi:hypothetical protein